MNTEGMREGSVVGREPDSDRMAEPAGQEPGPKDAPNNRSTPEAAPTGEALTDADITDAMIAAYLDANHAYWVAQDEIPPNAGKWRSGTAKEATRAGLRAALSTHPPAVQPVAPAARDVLAERQRQISAEGWTPEHDDKYQHNELSRAAACLATWAPDALKLPNWVPPEWPWDDDWWKPTDARRMLVKAGALILAEIERRDRATTPSAEAQPTPKEPTP